MQIAQSSRYTTAADLMALIEAEGQIMAEIRKTAVIPENSLEAVNAGKTVILHEQWLQSLKVGDTVAVLFSHGNENSSAASLMPVESIARGLITVAGVKFRILDGVRNSANTKWGPSSVVHPESEFARAAIRRRRFSAAINRLTHFREELSEEEVDILVQLANLRQRPHWDAIE